MSCLPVSLRRSLTLNQLTKFCPSLRVILVPDQLQRVTMKSNAEVKVESQSRPKEAVPQSRRVIEYNTIEKSVFEEIQKIDCLGSYGTKIETLVRHLLYLEDIEPGCKSIVFSAWADSLYSKAQVAEVSESLTDFCISSRTCASGERHKVLAN